MCDWILPGRFRYDCRCLMCLFILMLCWPVDSKHTPSVFTFLWAWIFSGVYALNEILCQDKLRKCLHSMLDPGRECTGHPCSWYHWLVHNYISHWLYFLTKFSFCFINHIHLPLNNVLDLQLSIFVPEESQLGSFMVIASCIMGFDCCELTHAHCLACCLLVCWESWQDNLQNVARNVQDWRQQRR